MILITGGTGLVGSHLLVHLLQKGHQCKAIFRDESSKKVTETIFSFYENKDALYHQIEWVQGDILDVVFLNEVMQNVQMVYHCAAIVSFNPAVKDQLFKINVEGTANMVNVALANNVDKFCYVSSIATFGRSDRQEMVTESTPWENSIKPSNYAISKYLAEQEVWRASEEGLSVIIVNPSAILGAGNWHRGSAALVRKVWEGLPYYTKGKNGFVDVLDVVACMIHLMESSIEGDRFLLVGENWTFHALVNAIADGLGKKRPSIHVTPLLAKIACYQERIRSMFTGKAPVITVESARVAQDSQTYSNAKVKKSIGHEFIPIDKTITRITKDFIRSTQA